MQERLSVIDKKTRDMRPVSLHLKLLKILHRLLNRLRGDVMLHVVSDLLGPPTLHLLQGAAHRSCFLIGIENDPAVYIPGRTATDLDERSLTAQKTLLIRIQ